MKAKSIPLDYTSLAAADVPPIPDARHVEEGGLKIDAVVDGYDCRWRLTLRGDVRKFIRYNPRSEWNSIGPWKDVFSMPEERST